VAIVRAALTGLLEFSACAEEVSTDVRTAVSEACNNVVMHAYPGRHGPMRVVAISGPDLFEVQVRDEGAGIHQISRDRLTGGAEHMGLGLALISALCDHVQVRNPAAGGTEVTMRFRTGEHEADDGFSPAQSWADGPEQPPYQLTGIGSTKPGIAHRDHQVGAKLACHRYPFGTLELKAQFSHLNDKVVSLDTP
jgi:anti-sigma regulatory factor (Ser/Thr protein kinase)